MFEYFKNMYNSDLNSYLLHIYLHTYCICVVFLPLLFSFSFSFYIVFYHLVCLILCTVGLYIFYYFRCTLLFVDAHTAIKCTCCADCTLVEVFTSVVYCHLIKINKIVTLKSNASLLRYFCVAFT